MRKGLLKMTPDVNPAEIYLESRIEPNFDVVASTAAAALMPSGPKIARRLGKDRR
jgi:hypothetical protein